MECLFVYPILANRPVSLGSGRSLASTEREDGTVVLLAHINIAAGRESSTWWLSVSTLTFEGGEYILRIAHTPCCPLISGQTLCRTGSQSGRQCGVAARSWTTNKLSSITGALVCQIKLNKLSWLSDAAHLSCRPGLAWPGAIRSAAEGCKALVWSGWWKQRAFCIPGYSPSTMCTRTDVGLALDGEQV